MWTIYQKTPEKGFILESVQRNVPLYFYLSLIICLHDIKYSYLILIIYTQYYGFKYSYLILIIYSQFLFDKHLYLVWFEFYGISTFVGYLTLNPFLYK